MKCQKCGFEHEGNFCPKCGAKGVPSSPPPPSMPCEQVVPYPEISQTAARNNFPIWVIILLLIVFFPAGIALMWIKAPWNKAAKIGATVAMLCLVMAVGISSLALNPADTLPVTTSKTGSTTSQTTTYETIDYKELARNPEKYKGKNVKFTGQVIQVSEGLFRHMTYRISVTKDQYDTWDDTVYVTYTLPKDAPHILEKDIVTFYGVCYGTQSYKTVLGAKVTLPYVSAHRIDIQ